jgi:asparagine synthase (glutamine-hydrolysing)
MFRYIALSWDTHDFYANSAAQTTQRAVREKLPTWVVAFEQPGLFVACAPASTAGEVYPLAGRRGAIVGTLFEAQTAGGFDDPLRDVVFGPSQTESVVSSRGRTLVDSHWGSYVAFLCDTQTRETRVIRGPMSGLLCLHMEFKRVFIFFSRMEDAIALGVLQFSINWNYLRAFVAFGEPNTRETGLNEVSLIPVGECLLLSDKGPSRTAYWHPCDVARSNVVDSAREATTLLRSTTRRCVSAWGSRHQIVVHRLSGGLDSAIVLACLKGAANPPEIICLNHFTTGALGDERRYARAMAAQARCRLIERELDSELSLGIFHDLRLTCRPMRHYGEYVTYRPDVALARDNGASAIFCGELGDTVFGMSGDPYSASEYIHRHGYGPSLLSVAREVADRRRLSIWAVLRDAIRGARVSHRKAHWTQYLFNIQKDARALAQSTLIHADAFADALNNIDRYTNPWFRSVSGVPLSKLWTICALQPDMYAESPLRGPDDPSMAVPLASQPLVDLALRIPAYLTIRNGQDRILARDAFATELTPEILSRTSKGSSDVWSKKLLARNIQFLRGFLLDGVLARERVLDRELLDSVLVAGPSRTKLMHNRLIRHLYTEGWLRGWQSKVMRVAA